MPKEIYILVPSWIRGGEQASYEIEDMKKYYQQLYPQVHGDRYIDYHINKEGVWHFARGTRKQSEYGKLDFVVITKEEAKQTFFNQIK